MLSKAVVVVVANSKAVTAGTWPFGLARARKRDPTQITNPSPS